MSNEQSMSNRESPEQVARECVYVPLTHGPSVGDQQVAAVAAAIRARDVEHAAELAELKAQCAGMRAALEVATTHRPEDREAVLRAFSGTAGKELLERVGEALTYIGNAKRDIPGGWAAAYGGDWKGWIEKAERRLRAATGDKP